jgi:hypothetical protein
VPLRGESFEDVVVQIGHTISLVGRFSLPRAWGECLPVISIAGALLIAAAFYAYFSRLSSEILHRWSRKGQTILPLGNFCTEIAQIGKLLETALITITEGAL